MRITQTMLVLLTCAMLGALTVQAQSSLWLSYTLPLCDSNEPARFYVYVAGQTGQEVVISITMLNSLVTDPKRQEASYRVTQAKAAVIPPGGFVQNLTFWPKELPGPVEVRATVWSGADSLKGIYKRLPALCR